MEARHQDYNRAAASGQRRFLRFGLVPAVIDCADHAHPGFRAGFQAESRLKQYAFLLNVALLRL